MPVTDSPLRYPGGKTQLAPLVLDVIKINDLTGGIYAEPFAGGAGVAWRLLLNGDVGEAWINDIDPAIYAFWRAVILNPDPLCERIVRTRVTMAQWYRQRKVLANFQDSSELDLAFATLFLNRTNRSGILKGGVIGGKDQAGDYRLDCRFNKDELVRKILRIHNYRDVIRVSRMDAKKCLQLWTRQLPSRCLVNIDPPYFSQGQDLYLSFYGSRDHARLAGLIRQLPLPWMLTYDEAPEIANLYEGMPIYRKSLVYYAQVKRRAAELLMLAPHLKAPSTLEQAA